MWHFWPMRQPGVAHRKLTTHQKAVLIQVLRVFPDQHVSLTYYPAANDALSYARDFLSIFKAIGWEVSDPEFNMIRRESSAGLALVSGREGCLPPCAEALRDALRIYGIEVETFVDTTSEITPGSFILNIGMPE
jgi:hypothetical protein